ncbi:MAG TPA: hypothetical protein VK851_01905 [Anaerolineales bacterium]|nr:hypothetical protein [Anaerolineales bacterium]
MLEIHGYVSPHAFGPEMASQAQLFNDQLFWDFACFEADMDQDTAQAIVEEIEGIMTSVIASKAKQSPIMQEFASSDGVLLAMTGEKCSG